MMAAFSRSLWQSVNIWMTAFPSRRCCLGIPGHAPTSALSQVIACVVHPPQNLGVLRRLRALALPEDEAQGWARAVIRDGLTACAALIATEAGPFCFGDSPTLADVCLVPQLANARRFGVAVERPRLIEIEAACALVPAFIDATPERDVLPSLGGRDPSVDPGCLSVPI
jgi:glutathione S-transferase